MSELEYIKVLINGQPFDMYFKSDVDAVLAEKDKQLRRHKFKRCLAMARWCEGVKELNRYGDQDYMDFAKKWRKRWLELAEKFKDKETE